jgi:D-3-phosphoglycerate dehydrogenase
MKQPRFRVVHTDARTDAPLEIERRELAAVNAEVLAFPCKNEEDVMQATRQADGILNSAAPITRRVIENLERCRVIVRYGIGVDTIDVEAATERGIVVANVPDFCLEEVANHAILLLMACAKKLVRLDRAVRAGEWARKREILRPMGKIAGQTLGLVAFGKIPQALVPKARALQLRLLVYDPFVPPELFEAHGVTPVGFDDVLSRSDFVSVHTPLTQKTRGMFGEREFHLMKPSAFFINTSRGPVVQESALIAALREGRIAGAGLDVLEQEPVTPDNPLLEMPNVILTPHTASYSDAAFTELPRRVAGEAARVLSGQWPTALVNPAVKAKVRLRA